MQIWDLFGSVRLEGDSAVVSRLNSIGDIFENIGGTLMKVGQGLTDNITEPLLDIAGQAVETTMGFDVAMSKMQANSQMTGKDFDKMRNLALKMGQTTSKTASEAADALGYMALAGWDVNEMGDSLEPILRASEAGMMDLGRTSDLVTDSMAALGIGTEDLGRYLDIAAKAQSSSNQSMQQFLEAMVTAGGSFKMFNVPLEEAGGLLGILANRGFKAHEAGNAIISIMSNLTTGTGKAGKAMKKLEIDVYDGNKKFRGMTVILKELNEKFNKMTEAQRNTYIQMIGGKTRTKEFNALLNGTNDELDELTKKLHNSEGALTKLAKTMQDNLAGKITKLKSAFEGLLIVIGDKLTPIISFFADVVQEVADVLLNLPSPIHSLILIIGGLVATIGPAVTILGILVTAVGGVITAITALVALITTVGLPVFLAITAAVIFIIDIVVQATAVFTILAGAFTLLIARMGIFSDGLATIKALISGDFTTMFDLLTKKLGMTEALAKLVAGAFTDMYEKAKIVVTVIKDNLSNVFDMFVGKVTDGLGKLNGSSQASKSLFIDMVMMIVGYGHRLFDYFYDVFDTFGLIPTKLKFANDKIALEFVELKAKTDSSLNEVLNSQFMFSEKMTKQNREAYGKKVEDTKNSLKAELDFVIQHMDEKQRTELSKLQELFQNSKVLTQEQEAERMELVKQNYQDEKDLMMINYEEINNIIRTAYEEKRKTTEAEDLRINDLRKQMSEMEVKIISDSKMEQLRILEESKNLATEITRKEALQIITETNKAYDKEVSSAKKKRDKKINFAVMARDQLGAIGKEEASKIIKEANRQYKESVKKAKQTKNETIDNASKKAGGVIKEADKERREVSDQTERLKKALSRIWKDVKKEIPGIVVDLMMAIIKVIAKNTPSIVAAMFEAGAEMVGAIIRGISSKFGELAGKVAKVVKTVSKLSSLPILGGIIGHASGIRNFEGGLTWVGETGPELMYVPPGSNIYTHAESKNMVSRSENENSKSGDVYNVSVVIDAKNIKEFNDVVDFVHGIKVEAVARGSG